MPASQDYRDGMSFHEGGQLIRETYDDDLYKGEGHVLDEIVAEGAAIHIERLSKRWWMCIIEVQGQYIQLNLKDLILYERVFASLKEQRSANGHVPLTAERGTTTPDYLPTEETK